MPVIANKITPDSIVYADQWCSYNALNVTGSAIIELIILLTLKMGKSY